MQVDLSRLQKALDALVAKSGAQGAKNTEEVYAEEVQRINRDAEDLRKREHGASGFIPAFYQRTTNAAADDIARLTRSAAKAFEMNLRLREIELLDEMHAKLWDLLTLDGTRAQINAEEYMEVQRQFAASFGTAAAATPPGSSPAEAPAANADGGAPLPSPRARVEEAKSLSGTSPSPARGASSTASARVSVPRSNSARIERAIRIVMDRGGSGSVKDGGGTESVRRGASPQPQAESALAPEPLGDTLFAHTIPLPRPTMELFLACPRNVLEPNQVEVTEVYQAFAKQVSLVKCEVELLMWDTNNDGRLFEDELESYVRQLVPRVAALAGMSEELLPFYCCTASRCVFWALDVTNRGAVRIDALLTSAVMDEWVDLQLQTVDVPRNWFGLTVTQQIYEKFLLLDSRNEGTLDRENLRRYKKGLPTNTNDGLPIDISPLSSLFIDRYFETNVMMANAEVDYRKFVDFVIAIERLPQCGRPTFFWYIFDFEGRGELTPMMANYFFRETHAKMVEAGISMCSRETMLQEYFDLIATKEPLLITKEEFIQSPNAGLFSSLLIDCLSVYTYERREDDRSRR